MRTAEEILQERLAGAERHNVFLAAKLKEANAERGHLAVLTQEAERALRAVQIGERPLRDMTLDRDRWRRRAQEAEAHLASLGVRADA